MAIKFNNINIPAFVLVNKVTNSLLPEIEQKTVKVPGRAGMYDFGNEIGNREIEVEYTIVADNEIDLKVKAREFAEWLYYEEVKPLVLLDEPDKTYYAKLSGSTELDEVLHVGQGNLTFICYDPYAYGAEETVNIAGREEGEEVPVTNTGDVPVYPKLHFEFAEPTTEFAVISGDRYMYFGQPADAGVKEPAPQRIKVLHDDCSSLANYTSGIHVDGGVITGSFTSDGNLIRVSDYGEGTGWHGAAAVRTIGKNLQDFSLQAEVAFKEGYAYQVGRLEIYLLDQNNTIIGKIAIRDSSGSVNNPYMEARAGTSRYFVNYTGKVGRWAGFGGAIRITRKGLQWEFSASKRATNGSLYDTFSYSFYDKDGLYQQQLAGYQIHIGAHGTLPQVSTLYFDSIDIWEENTYTPETEVPYVFDTGDILDIDCSTGTILKNQLPFYEALDPGSSFLKLEPGENSILTTPQVFSVGNLSFTERWR